jgi:hypothetical protein
MVSNGGGVFPVQLAEAAKLRPAFEIDLNVQNTHTNHLNVKMRLPGGMGESRTFLSDFG